MLDRRASGILPYKSEGAYLGISIFGVDQVSLILVQVSEEEDASTVLAFRSLDPSKVFKANHPLHGVPPHELFDCP
ncbi:hypothetical protein GN958_ATG00339 [Phytophthora infestans]|uniref:Uncharacterized protein n=1 Tax=Phytophthora infestans TaxID=4787 RepID=A0A8S9VE68_PHYIN|nr:hypothetical protein GN958_ATG00339 [Phytophthora infestans]